MIISGHLFAFSANDYHEFSANDYHEFSAKDYHEFSYAGNCCA